MGKVLGGLLFIALITALGVFYRDYVSARLGLTASPQTQIVPSPSPTPLPLKSYKSLFVPYWNVEEGDWSRYDRLIYFGITGALAGVNTGEDGYRALDAFAARAAGRTTYLTLRLLDGDTNLALLQNPKAQAKLVADTIDLANQYGFTGLVLDFELSALFDDAIPGQINEFAQRLYDKAQENGLKLALTMYGDVFYRKRPYDVRALAQNADEILIMAYDFHKTSGEPGPNFPLKKGALYSYDFTSMIGDFSRRVPSEKLSVIFGMYGYDWLVDEEKRPIRPAKSLSLIDMKKEFLSACEWKNCVVVRDRDAAETEVNYVDAAGGLHIVWFEDEESVSQKSEFLKQKGIENTAYWVNGYF